MGAARIPSHIPPASNEEAQLKMTKTKSRIFAALALTVVLSWTFVDATSLARVPGGAASHGVVAAVSALVR